MITAHKIVNISNRVARAKEFLLTQFKDQPNINLLVDVLVSELQELENALTDMQDARTLKNGYGTWLDEIGKKLRISRGSYNDNDYKTAMKIVMAKKTASATSEDIIRIVSLLTGDNDVRLENNYPYLLELTSFFYCVAEDQSGLKAIGDLFPVGTRVRLIQTSATPFKFSTVGRGFGNKISSLIYKDYGIGDDIRFTRQLAGTIPPSLPVPPFFTSTPFITGTGEQGQTLILNNGVVGGDAPITFSYQWLRNDVNISGQTSGTYLVVSGDLGASITCRVTATNIVGNTSLNTNNININSSAPVADVINSEIGIRNIWSATNWLNAGEVTATSSVNFLSDGVSQIVENNTITNLSWLNTTGAGLGSNYEVSYIVIDGLAFSNLNPSVTHTLSTGITFAISNTAQGNSIKQGTYRFTIRDKTDTSIVVSKTINITAEVVDAIN